MSKWRTVSSKSVIKDRWIDVRADRCLTPSGTEISPYFVLAYPDWVHVVALTEQHQLLLVKQYRYAAGEIFLELPAGAVEKRDESIEDAARREVSEETGFFSDRWLKVSSLYTNPATHTHTPTVFIRFLHSMLKLSAVNNWISARKVLKSV